MVEVCDCSRHLQKMVHLSSYSLQSNLVIPCSLYDQIFKPSKFPANADFHLFKAGVEPKWEDPECANGGKWTVTSSKKSDLDSMWLETVRNPGPLLMVTASVIIRTNKMRQSEKLMGKKV